MFIEPQKKKGGKDDRIQDVSAAGEVAFSSEGRRKRGAQRWVGESEMVHMLLLHP